MSIFNNIIKLAVFASLVLLSIMNVQQVELTYFFNQPSIKMPLFVVLIGALIFGFILSSMLYFFERISLTGEIKQLKKKAKANEEEIKKLRALAFNAENNKEL